MDIYINYFLAFWPKSSGLRKLEFYVVIYSMHRITQKMLFRGKNLLKPKQPFKMNICSKKKNSLLAQYYQHTTSIPKHINCWLGWVINKWCNWLSLFAFLAWKLVTFQSVSGSQVRGSQSEGSRHIYGETGLKGQEIKWLVSDRRWIEGLHETPRWKKYGLFWTLVCAKL